MLLRWPALCWTKCYQQLVLTLLPLSCCCNRRVIWLRQSPPPGGFALNYQTITMHAISQDPEAFSRPCIYAQVEPSTSGEYDDNEDEVDESPELRLVPAASSACKCPAPRRLACPCQRMLRCYLLMHGLLFHAISCLQWLVCNLNVLCAAVQCLTCSRSYASAQR